MIRLALALAFIMSVSLRAEEPRRDRFGDPLPTGAVARLGTVNAHPYASSVAFSGDGRTIITTSGAAVRHWDAESGRVKRTFALPEIGVFTRRVVSTNGRIAAWPTADGLEIYDVEHDRSLYRVKLGDGKDIFGISHSGDLVLIRAVGAKGLLVVRNGKLESWADVKGEFEDAVFLADGKSVALRQKIGYAMFRGTGPEAQVVKLTGTCLVYAVAPDGSTLVADADDEQPDESNLALIDSRTGQPVPGAKFAITSAPRSVSFSNDSRLLAIATDKEVTLWDVATKKRRWSVPGRAGRLAFSPDGRRLAGIDHLLTVWDVTTGKAVSPDFGPLPNYLISEEPRHNRIVMGNSVTGHFQVWDWTTARVCFSTEFSSHGSLRAGWLSADGARLYLCAPQKAQAWEIATGKLLREFNPTPPDLANEPWEMTSLGYATPDGAAFSVLVVDRSDGKEQLRCVFVHWDSNTGKQLFRRELELPKRDSVGITQDAWGIWTSKFREADHVFDARTGRERPPAYEPSLRFVVGVYTRDDAVFAGMDVFEAAARKSILRVPIAQTRLQHAGIASVWRSSAITPDGRWAAFALRDGIELWDVIEQRQIPFHPAYAPPDAASFHAVQLMFPSNDRLLVQYDDMSTLIWELPPAARGLPTARISATTWEHLGDWRPLIAQRAVWALKRDPDAGVELLRRGKRVEPPDAKTLAGLWADLGDPDFAKRDAATKSLRPLGRPAATFLTAALEKDANAEQRRRAKLLLDEFGDQPPNPDDLRAIRAVQAAELIGTDAAKALLAEWAKGDPAAVLTREAQAALKR